MSYTRIPRDRVAILIGKNGAVRREIEERASCEIIIDGGSVEIRGDGVKTWIAKDIVLAIARGFNPEFALRLLNDEFTFELIKLDEFIKSEKELKRKKGRVIGEGGKSKRVIENLTDTHIAVYGKTIGIIGLYDNVHIAKEAIIRLLGGSGHRSAYHFLEEAMAYKSQP